MNAVPSLLATTLAIVSLVVSAMTIGGALIAVGALLQKIKELDERRLKDLEERHRESAQEHRQATAELRGRVGALEVKSERSAALIESSRARKE